LQVKKALTGNGKATKEQVAFMVKRVLNIKKAYYYNLLFVY